VAGAGAVAHFGLIRSAFMARVAAVPAGVIG